MNKPELPRPFPDHFEKWTDDDWRQVPVVWVPIMSLIPSQEGLSLEVLARLMNGEPPKTHDYSRAILWRGDTYLFDGHHRWIIDVIKNCATFPVRLAW